MSAPTYILGAGSIGCLLASQLCHLERSPVTLLLKNESRLRDFVNNDRKVNYENLTNLRNPILTSHRVSALKNAPKTDSGSIKPIENLIVTTKCHQTVEAISKYRDSITDDTNIVLVQNGMGMSQELQEKVFHSVNPRIFQGIISHGVYLQKPFNVKHAGIGDLRLCALPTGKDQFEDEVEVPEIIQSLIQAPLLNGQYTSFSDCSLLQMEKLIVNACVNPLTGILDCYNGELLRIENVSKMMTRVVSECVATLSRTVDMGNPTNNVFFNKERLYKVVIAMIKATYNNSTSMREDLRHMRATEIDYINGYIVKMAKKTGVSVPMNAMLMDMVKARHELNVLRSHKAMDLVI